MVSIGVRRRFSFMIIIGFCLLSGCGTTRTSNTLRTATEQLLVSDAIDRAVQAVNFQALRGKSVYFDEEPLKNVVDNEYLISSLRQHLLASGSILKDIREDAEYIVEPRAGAVGTDNHDLLFGLPATNVPQLTLLAALPPVIPEIPIAKRRDQRGIAKISVFAYQRETGIPIWQSGIVASESTANDIWILGAGPFKRGTIYEGTSFASSSTTKSRLEEIEKNRTQQTVQLDQEEIFHSPAYNGLEDRRLSENTGVELSTPATNKIQQATHMAPVQN
ncbi:MAG: DUF6655 family protein [Pirellulales bacterium]